MEDLSEKEQLDAFRAWWSENGNYVIGGILAGVIIIFGVNQWRTTKANEEIAASTLYEDVMFAAGSSDLDGAIDAAAGLFSDYNSTAYASQARLALARMYMDNARDQDAADTLTALVDANPDNEIGLVGRLRLAKILLYQGKAEEVVGLIKDEPESGFSARFNEVLGDAYVALEQFPEAEIAFMASLNDNPQAPTVDSALIQLKINDLPEVSDAASEAEGDEPVEIGAPDKEAGESATGEPPAEETVTGPATDNETGNE